MGSDEPPGRGRVISLEDVYRFEPMPAGLAAAHRHHVLGVQANLWTEHVRTEERAEYMSFPRAAAVAELGWSQPEHIDWPDFRRRVQAAFTWYGRLGLHYADTTFRAPAAQVAGANALRRSQELELCADKLTLSLEDDAPLRGDARDFPGRHHATLLGVQRRRPHARTAADRIRWPGTLQLPARQGHGEDQAACVCDARTANSKSGSTAAMASASQRCRSLRRYTTRPSRDCPRPRCPRDPAVTTFA